MIMELDKIHHANETQIRVQLDMYAVEDYARAMKEGEDLPPIDLFFDGEIYWLGDGFHRVAAAKKIGWTSIACSMHEGSKADAIVFAVDKNKVYGVRIRSEDKRRMVGMFLNDLALAEWSNYEIAKRCGVAEGTVRNHRNAICVNYADSSKPTTRKAKRNGKTYTIDTSNIGSSGEVKDCPDRVRSTEIETYQDDPVYIPKINVINADAQYLSSLNIAPVHLVVTSPPYNVGIDYDAHIDDMGTYVELITAIWKQCYSVMVEGARIAVVVPFGIGRNPYVPFDCKVMQTIMNAGFDLRGRIVWDKGTTGGRTTWGSFRLPSDPGLRDTTECIIVAHKGQSKLEIPSDARLKDEKGTYTKWLNDSDEFMSLAQDHWVIAPESAKRVGHPAPFPVKLAENLMKFYAYPGAHILDPFGGSGTVGVASKRLGCDATIVDISEEYCNLAKGRIDGSL